jgi:cyclic pyranopterin phosphate synthase
MRYADIIFLKRLVMAIDQYGRRIHYLRISLTDHCNLRCIYCMPEEMTFRPPADLMQDDEILRLVHIFAGLGFDKIRLTGGEPTVRAGIVNLVNSISKTPGVKTLSMTSNGVLFSRLAIPLAEAGLNRINFSLDTLDPDRFHYLTRWGSLEEVWKGIEAAEQAGLNPIKINAVIVRNYNEEDIIPLAQLTVTRPWQVRFIEMMPFGGKTEFQRTNVVTSEAVQSSIEAVYGGLNVINSGKLDGEARIYQIPGAKGNLGFISTVTQPFCSSCTRLRLTADGRLRLCLLNEQEVDLLTPMRTGVSNDDLNEIIRQAIWEKPWGNGLADGLIPVNRVMSQIGG